MTKHFQSPFYRSILKVRKTSVRSITTQLSNHYFEYFNIILEIVKNWLNWYMEHFKFIYKGGSWTGETFSGIELFCIIKYHRYSLRFLKKETRSSSFNFRSLKIHSDKSKIYPKFILFLDIRWKRKPIKLSSALFRGLKTQLLSIPFLYFLKQVFIRQPI